jgi:hypothetical protein
MNSRLLFKAFQFLKCSSLSTSLILGISSCVSTLIPLENYTASQNSDGGNQTAYLGLSVQAKSATYRGSSTVELYLKEETSDRKFKLKMVSDRVSGAQIPLVFQLVPGTYSVEKTLLKIPGGTFGGQGYLPLEVVLESVPAHKNLFKLQNKEFLHVGNFEYSVSVSLENNTAPSTRYSSSFQSTLPSEALWQQPLSSLKPASVTYLRKGIAAIEQKSWERRIDGGRDEMDSNREVSASEIENPDENKNRNTEINRQFQKVSFDIRSCFKKNFATFKGEAKLNIFVPPEGYVEKFDFDTLTNAPQSLTDCVAKAVKPIKLSKRSDGQSDTWVFTYKL